MSAITDKILKLANTQSVVRPRDVDGVEDASPYLRAMTSRGVLLQVGRGLYTLADRERSRSFSLIQTASRVRGVVCLISALEFHGFTSQIGYEVWMSVCHTGKLTITDLPVRIIRMSGAAYSHGVEEHVIDGNVVHVYTPAKTVADCFRFRSKVGLDVALEALREGWRERKFTMDELSECCRVNRVQSVIRPYLEAIIS